MNDRARDLMTGHGLKRARISVVIPALDEERSIGDVIRQIDRTVVDEVIVGDNGSRDRTAAVSLASGAKVVHAPRRGYGAACAAALRIVSPRTGIIVFMDADGSDDPKELRGLIGPIISGEADLVVGSRALGEAEPGALSPQQRFGNWLATRLIRILYRHRYTDLGPFRAIRRTLLDEIDMQDRRYGWTVEMQIRAVQLGAKIQEVPAVYRRRIGKSKISGTVRGVALAGFWILYTIARHSPLGSRLSGTRPAEGSEFAAGNARDYSHEAQRRSAQ